MAEYIEREAVLHLFGEVPAYTGYETYPVGVHTLICEIAPLIKDAIRKIPAADVATVRHGRWLYVDTDTEQFFLCNRCKKKEYWESNYCPNCGADMRGSNDE